MTLLDPLYSTDPEVVAALALWLVEPTVNSVFTISKPQIPAQCSFEVIE